MNKNVIKKELKKKNRILVNYNWIIKIIIISFAISICFTYIAETAVPNVSIFLGILLVVLFILIGVIFDMIGVSVAAADEVPFHSMAAQKVKGAKTAVKLKKNADKVSSFCNDVVGDICGIISGSTGAVIAIKIVNNTRCNSLLITLLVMAVISAFTIGGKAIVKTFAINKSNVILFKFARILSIFNND